MIGPSQRPPLFSALALAALALALWLGWLGSAHGQPMNLIAAVDISQSISREEEDEQFNGLAAGLQNPEFVSLAVDRGAAVAVFTWASEGAGQVILPWTIISSPEQARAAAAIVASAPRRELLDEPYTVGFFDTGGGTETSFSEALDRAFLMAATAPFTAGRVVINLMSDGVSNKGPHPSTRQAIASDLGYTINGVVFSEYKHTEMETEQDYFRRHVITGQGAFVERAAGAAEIGATLQRKFLQDMIAARQQRPIEGG